MAKSTDLHYNKVHGDEGGMVLTLRFLVYVNSRQDTSDDLWCCYTH